MDNSKATVAGRIRNARGQYRVTPDTDKTGHIDILENGTWTTITDSLPDEEINTIIIEVSKGSVSTSSRDVGKKQNKIERSASSSAAKIING